MPRKNVQGFPLGCPALLDVCRCGAHLQPGTAPELLQHIPAVMSAQRACALPNPICSRYYRVQDQAIRPAVLNV